MLSKDSLFRFSMVKSGEKDEHMDVSKNRGTPKRMVYNGNPIKMDDLGVPLFLETPISFKLPFGRIPRT